MTAGSGANIGKQPDGEKETLDGKGLLDCARGCT